MLNVLFLFSVTFLFKFLIVFVLSPHNTLAQVPGFIPSGFGIFFIASGSESESFHLFFGPPAIVVLQVYVNAMLAQYVF